MEDIVGLNTGLGKSKVARFSNRLGDQMNLSIGNGGMSVSVAPPSLNVSPLGKSWGEKTKNPFVGSL